MKKIYLREEKKDDLAPFGAEYCHAFDFPYVVIPTALSKKEKNRVFCLYIELDKSDIEYLQIVYNTYNTDLQKYGLTEEDTESACREIFGDRFSEFIRIEDDEKPTAQEPAPKFAKSLYERLADSARYKKCLEQALKDMEDEDGYAFDLCVFQVEVFKDKDFPKFKYDFETKQFDVSDEAEPAQIRNMANIIEEIERRTLELFEKGE